MQLSDLLTRLFDAFPSVDIGSPDEVQRQRDSFRDALRKAVLHAEGQEQALRMLEARQMPSIHEDALVVALSTGKVSILPVRRSLVAHSFDDRPDRRFGEDREMPF